MKDSKQVRQEIEALEASSENTWANYLLAMEEATKKLEEYRVDAQALSELYAEEQLLLARERGNSG